MFKVAEKTDLNQISLTGVRALIMIGLLIVEPRSLADIKNILVGLKIMEEFQPEDILRVDLNTIKSMGCEISRCSPKTNYKYVLTKHPFSLKISKEELLALKSVYKQIKIKSNISTLLEYDLLFRKIALYICDEESKEALLGISIFKYFDIDFVKDLMQDCKYKRKLELIYKSTSISKETIKNIIAQKIVFKNDKFYLYGFDLGIKRTTVLNLKRIKSILQRSKNNEDFEIEEIRVRFLLKDIKTEMLESEEEIVEKTNEGYLVEGFYFNDFIATQRILSFGSNCTVVEPLEFKKRIINKVKEMRNIYE